MKKTAFILAATTTLTITVDSLAQTAMGNGSNRLPPTPNEVRQFQNQSLNNTSPRLPVSNAVVKQAKEQIDGNFAPMDRSSVGGQIQPVWDETAENEGFFEYEFCEACIYKVRIREYMVSTLVLPKGKKIHSFDIGDPGHFEVKQRADNMLAVQAVGGGIDTNLTVYMKDGSVFPFYLRAENFNSKNVPDLVVRINGVYLPDRPVLKTASLPSPRASDSAGISSVMADSNGRKHSVKTGDSEKDSALSGLQKKTGSSNQPADFVEKTPFDPDRLRGFNDYELWGDEELRPEMVFRDDHFTYVKFGDRWNDVDLPTAYVVVDEIDELVNTRVQGTTFIIESTKPLISLKAGKKFLCIQYKRATS